VERDSRKKHERVIVFKNMFDIEDFEVCVSSSIELASNFKELCHWVISCLKKIGLLLNFV